MTAIPPELDIAYQKALAQYQSRPEITGIDVGWKYSENNGHEERQGDLAVRFMVRKKVARDQLTEDEILPPVIPVTLQGREIAVPTDVIESRIDAALDRLDLAAAAPQDLKERRKRRNPLQPGVSVSHASQGAGTLGLIVHCQETGEAGILSCAHVLALASARKGDPVYQPSLVDGGDLRFDVIAHLDRWLLDQDGDAAFARLNRSRMVELQQFGNSVTITSVARQEVTLGERLEKCGRGSGRTSGMVDGIGRYRLDLSTEGSVWIDGFRLVPEEKTNGNGAQPDSAQTQTSLPGDSGAVWYRNVRAGGAEGVGLHIDGEDPGETPEYAIACHLPRVMKRLKLDVAPVLVTPSRLPKLDVVFPKRKPGTKQTLPPKLAKWAADNHEEIKELWQLCEELVKGPANGSGNGQGRSSRKMSVRPPTRKRTKEDGPPPPN